MNIIDSMKLANATVYIVYGNDNDVMEASRSWNTINTRETTQTSSAPERVPEFRYGEQGE